MCVTHTCGLAGAAGGWHPPKNLVPAGMFNGHPPHVWVVLLGPSVRDASRGSQRYRGEVRLWANRPCPVCPAGLAPPTPYAENAFSRRDADEAEVCTHPALLCPSGFRIDGSDELEAGCPDCGRTVIIVAASCEEECDACTDGTASATF